MLVIKVTIPAVGIDPTKLTTLKVMGCAPSADGTEYALDLLPVDPSDYQNEDGFNPEDPRYVFIEVPTPRLKKYVQEYVELCNKYGLAWISNTGDTPTFYVDLRKVPWHLERWAIPGCLYLTEDTAAADVVEGWIGGDRTNDWE